MRRSNRRIFSAALAACVLTAGTNPATASPSRELRCAAEYGVPHEDGQNPCQSQLVKDLKECEDHFGGPFKPRILIETCSRGAYGSYQACLVPKPPA